MNPLKTVFAVALTCMLAAAVPANAQGVRATAFLNNNYIWNPGFPDDSPLSPEGVVSAWYDSSTPPTFTNPATLMEAWSPTYQGFIIFLLSVANFVNDPYGLADGLHLRMYISDGQGGTPRYAVWVSNELIRFDGRYHSLAMTWDTNSYNPATNQFLATGSYSDAVGNIIPLTWNAHYSISDGSAQTFQTPWTNAPWYVAAHVPLSGSPTNFFRGNLAQLYGHFEVGDYNAILNFAAGSGFARQQRDRVTNAVISYFPEELGDQCERPLGGSTLTLPALCLRGGMPDFLVNQGGATSFRVPSGFPAPVTATIDPWGVMP